MQVRVNYYLRELWGEPEAYPDAWAAPFGVLALQGPTAVFVHPLVCKAYHHQIMICLELLSNVNRTCLMHLDDRLQVDPAFQTRSSGFLVLRRLKI